MEDDTPDPLAAGRTSGVGSYYATTRPSPTLTYIERREMVLGRRLLLPVGSLPNAARLLVGALGVARAHELGRLLQRGRRP